jgi:hypothetical protein
MSIEWLDISAAAKALGLSPATLRRRARDSHWQEGRQWRWAQVGKRQTRQFHIPSCIAVINRTGW